ncbi:MAG: cobalamin-dependent protein [Chitinophagaceae bacterium]
MNIIALQPPNHNGIALPIRVQFNKKTATMVACTVSGNLHELGIRMVADLFEIDGWNTYYLGANMPDNHIISALKENKADLLAISASMPDQVTIAAVIIKKIRNDASLNRIKVLVGGYPFNQIQDLWKKIGADGYMNTAKEAIELANKMMLPNYPEPV